MAVLSAEIALGGITGTVADAYGNPVTAGITFAAGQGCLITAFGGAFDNAGTASSTNNIVGGGASCTGTGTVASTSNYFQSSLYGATGTVQIQVTGTYAAASFAAHGKSQSLRRRPSMVLLH